MRTRACEKRESGKQPLDKGLANVPVKIFAGYALGSKGPITKSAQGPHLRRSVLDHIELTYHYVINSYIY